MQNIVKETLKAGESIRAAGAKYLLVRDATNSLTLRVDTLEPVEVKKNDVVLTEGCTMLELCNHHASAVTIQYQITDLAINTQSDAVAVSGAVTVDEINKPIVVSGIQSTVGVRFDGAMEVSNFPAIQKVELTNPKDIQKVEVTNQAEVQKVQIENHQTIEFPMIQATREAAPNVVVNHLIQPEAATDAIELLPVNENRKSALVVTDAQVFIGGAGVTQANGIPTSSSSPFVIESTAQYFVVAPTGASIRILEECYG